MQNFSVQRWRLFVSHWDLHGDMQVRHTALSSRNTLDRDSFVLFGDGTLGLVIRWVTGEQLGALEGRTRRPVDQTYLNLHRSVRSTANGSYAHPSQTLACLLRLRPRNNKDSCSQIHSVIEPDQGCKWHRGWHGTHQRWLDFDSAGMDSRSMAIFPMWSDLPPLI